MSLIESESIVLKTYDLADADKIVVLLTRDHGIVRAVAKGAKRLKSRFGSTLEPFSLLSATYLQKENLELVTLERTEMVRSSFAAASHPEFLRKFVFLGDLVIGLAAPHDPNEKLFRMVRAAIDAARPGLDELDAISVWFQIWLLRLSGFLPDWSRCSACGRPLAGDAAAYMLNDSGLTCPECSRGGVREVATEVRQLMADALAMAPAAFIETAERRRQAVHAIAPILSKFWTNALGRQARPEPFGVAA